MAALRVLCSLAALAVAAVFALAQAPYSGHGAASVSAEAIRKYAPPPLAPEVSRRIQAMLDVGSPGLGRVSPDGKRLFFDWSVTGTSAVWRLDGPRSFPVQLTGGEDRTRIVGLGPGGRLLALSRDRGGEEDPGLYLQPADGGPLRVVQHKKGSRASFGFFSDDASVLYYLANDQRPDSYAIHRYEIASGKSEVILSEPGLWSIADHKDVDGELVMLLAKATGALSSELFEWRASTKTLRPLLGQGESTEYEAAYAADTGELLVLSNKLSEFRRLYRWRDGALSAVTPELAMDVSSFSIDEARKRVYYTLNDGGYTRLRVLDAQTLKPLRFPEVKDADHEYAGPQSPDGRYVAVGVETAKAPRASYVYDWQTETLTQWVLSSAPEVDLGSFAVARLESYPARDGTRIPMFVRYPASCAPEAKPAAPCPVVVDFHGGPEGQARPGFSGYAQLFVDAGFIYVEPNVRGSDGYGKSWLHADDGPRRLEVIGDIEDCGRYWRERDAGAGRVRKLGITGGSYGGYSTLVGMTMFAGSYDAGVSVVGISNLQTFLENTAPYRRLLRMGEYGDPEKDGELLRKLSPISYLDRVTAPLLLIQGVDDPRVPAGEAIQIQEALASRGARSRLILIEGEGHGSARRGNRLIEVGHTLQFFEEQLGKRGS